MREMKREKEDSEEEERREIKEEKRNVHVKSYFNVAQTVIKDLDVSIPFGLY